jgi:methylaspartate mutase sigma subunit
MSEPVVPMRHTVVLSGVASDSHTWNLVYLQLLIEELGHEVINLGPCVPDELLLDRCLAHRPDLVVLSTVNGHGAQDGERVVRLLRSHEELACTPMVIGGKLGTNGPGDGERARQMVLAGFDAVFEDGSEAIGRFHTFLGNLPRRVLSS